MTEPTRTAHQLRISAARRAGGKRRKAAQDWSAQDGRANYEEAIREIRRRKIEAGEIEPLPHETGNQEE